MLHSRINSTDFRNLLAKFLENSFEITEEILATSEKFLFSGGELPDKKAQPELHSALTYLKNLMSRNNFTSLQDLLKYYEAKRKEVKNVFERLEKIDPEECFALDFHQACTMYMKAVTQEHNFKSNCLYYLHGSPVCDSVGFTIGEQKSHSIVISGSTTRDEIISFLSKIKGNHLVKKEDDGCDSPRRINELVCN
jgi:hypothetical protein